MESNSKKFSDKLKNIFGEKYDYNSVIYINNRTNVKLICKKHGEFYKQPKHLLTGGGCQKCSMEELKNKNLCKNRTIFFDKLKLIFKDEYDLTLVDYLNTDTTVKIICKKHGVFNQYPKHLLNGRGCQMCSKIKTDQKQTKPIEKVLNDFDNTHNFKYDYSLVEYVNTYTPVKIICRTHGIFNQIPRDHIRGYNCPKCNESKGETEIFKVLKECGIYFVQQKIFKNCIYKKPLKFDFYLPKYNTVIEYDGKQHFESVDFFGGEKGFSYIKKRDQIKNDYCEKNNITIIRIPYYEKNINKHIEKIIGID